MSDEEESVAFLQHHMENSFPDLMSNYLVLDIDWLEEYSGVDNGIRAIARLAPPLFPQQAANIICLFPPFFPKGANNKY